MEVGIGSRGYKRGDIGFGEIFIFKRKYKEKNFY